MRHFAFYAALALVLGVGAALADHAIEPDQANGDHAVQADRAVQTERAVEADQILEPVEADAETVVSGITREVCTVSDWGLGEVRRVCLTEVLPPREPNPAAKGICMIKYGVRSCY